MFITINLFILSIWLTKKRTENNIKLTCLNIGTILLTVYVLGFYLYPISELCATYIFIYMLSALFLEIFFKCEKKKNKDFLLMSTVIIGLVCSQCDDVISFIILIELFGFLSLSFYVLESYDLKELYSSQSGIISYILYSLIASLIFIIGLSLSINFYNISLEMFSNLYVIDYYCKLCFIHQNELGWLLIGFYFVYKFGIMPFHGWTLTFYKQFNLFGIYYLGVFSKLIFIIGFFVKFNDYFINIQLEGNILSSLGVISYIMSSFCAIHYRKDLQSILGYSSISQTSLLFIAFVSNYTSITAAYNYLFVYFITSSLILCIISKSESTTDIDGINKISDTVSVSNPNVIKSKSEEIDNIIILFSLTLLNGLAPLYLYINKLILFADLFTFNGILFSILILTAIYTTADIYLHLILPILLNLLKNKNALLITNLGVYRKKFDHENIKFILYLIFLLFYIFINGFDFVHVP